MKYRDTWKLFSAKPEFPVTIGSELWGVYKAYQSCMNILDNSPTDPVKYSWEKLEIRRNSFALSGIYYDHSEWLPTEEHFLTVIIRFRDPSVIYSVEMPNSTLWAKVRGELKKELEVLTKPKISSNVGVQLISEE